MSSDRPRPAAVTAASLIAAHSLQPHPEGGHYARLYTAPQLVAPHPTSPLPAAFTQQPRPFCTAIRFLLSRASPRSHLHRIAGDELWLHMAGRPIAVVELGSAGQAGTRTVLGRVEDGYEAYHCVEGGKWFGAELVTSDAEAAAGEGAEDEWVMVCCVVSGGFFFEEFELGDRDALLGQYPESAELVRKFTPDK